MSEHRYFKQHLGLCRDNYVHLIGLFSLKPRSQHVN